MIRALAAPDLPQAVIDNVHAYLEAIRQRKRYTGTLEFGVAPDTNLNAAPAANQVTLFGLPFTLTQASRPHSGVGLALFSGGEYFAPIAADWRWRVEATEGSPGRLLRLARLTIRNALRREPAC